MKINSGVSLHNKFDWVLEDSKTGKVKQQGTAYNVVLDRYYDTLPTTNALRLNAIFLGTGTGTPAVTDTGLFTFLAKQAGTVSNVTEIGTHQYSMTLTSVFSENQANGLLTEVGIGTSVSGVQNTFTHAMLTDAEGHTITVEKTNTDRLTVTATLYLTIQYSNSVIPYELSNGDYVLGCYVEHATTRELSKCPWVIRRAFGYLDNLNPDSLGLCASKATPLSPSEFTFTTSTTTITSGIRQTGARKLSTEWNKPFTYQIYGIYTAYGHIPLPNHTIFPPINLELETVGDGVSTGFNFGIPELTSDIQVWIDGVLQPANSYTWNGKDFTLRQAWVSQHGTYLIKQPIITSDGYQTYIASPIIRKVFGNGKLGTDKELVYDFGSPYQVNALRCNYQKIKLYYSSDGTNWTLAAENLDNSMVSFSPISARYWKTVWTAMNYVPQDGDWDAGVFFGAFDYVTNQLEFNSAPANGSVIKIQTKSEYPIKNSNWIIDQLVIDTTITRGSAP